MSNTSAQPTTGLVRRFVGNPNSTIGTMIKRGSNGNTVKSSPPAQEDVVIHVPIPKVKKLADVSSLKTLERVIDEVAGVSPAAEGVMSQVMPRVITEAADSLDQPKTAASSTNKEATESVSLDQIAADAARGAQQVELEPAPEIPPEVESYLQKVEGHRETAPEEIVIADGSQTQPTDHQYPSEPVVVLPITEKEERAGAKKSPRFSIRWLVEWSRRIMKIFAGEIIYRPIEESDA